MNKTAYKILGFAFLILAFVGIPLPVLPTTPFVIISAWCFARSSEKWHQWLLNSELFGPMLHRWEKHHCISMRTKVVALLTMLGVGSTSVLFALTEPWMRVLASCFMLLGCITLLRISTCAECDKSD